MLSRSGIDGAGLQQDLLVSKPPGTGKGLQKVNGCRLVNELNMAKDLGKYLSMIAKKLV